MNHHSLTRPQLTLLGGIFAVVIFLTYALTYQFEPFSELANLVLLDSMTIIAALTCTIILVKVIDFYHAGEPPRKIWVYFAIALGLWTLGEIIWSAYHLTMTEVPYLSAADGFWALGYVFFTAALVSQYRLVFFDKTNRPVWIALGIWIAAIVLNTIVLLSVQSEAFFTDFLMYFYPIGDLAVGVASLILVITFRGGTLARPWLSLFAFVFADSYYIWATSTGIYNWNPADQDMLTMFVELVYMAAYLFMGWGVFQQYLTLRFGATANRATAPIPRPKL